MSAAQAVPFLPFWGIASGIGLVRFLTSRRGSRVPLSKFKTPESAGEEVITSPPDYPGVENRTHRFRRLAGLPELEEHHRLDGPQVHAGKPVESQGSQYAARMAYRYVPPELHERVFQETMAQAYDREALKQMADSRTYKTERTAPYNNGVPLMSATWQGYRRTFSRLCVRDGGCRMPPPAYQASRCSMEAPLHFGGRNALPVNEAQDDVNHPNQQISANELYDRSTSR